ncbi:AAA family ATPase [Actinocrispum sp. NPDC049592]|uniref:ATP-dependent nuclease n=1 Tax=Actinocrispum sp. NPDC049592 TaxID=3154835 RepID=UPI0034411175
MDVDGFRGVNNLKLEFASPITAFCGLNGTGKSTIAQLIACAFRNPTTAALRRYYVKDFFPVSAADPTPFSEDASAIYTYTVERGADAQQVTVKRAQKEWSGYKIQPERACYYVGFTQFIPKVERRDFSIYRGHLAQLGENRPLDETTAIKISSILGIAYSSLSFRELRHGKRAAELATATTNGITYSENNMGFGEGRVVYMVRSMEEAPAQSLFVLEEPETSLHGEAQVRLAEYLVDACARRGHQIVLTTHSAAILQRLPSAAIVYLRREPESRRLEAFPGLPAYQIDAYLRGVGAKKDRTICVEDSFAKTLVCEILRQYARNLLAGSSVIPIGSRDEVHSAVQVLTAAGVKAAGVTDADAGHTGVDSTMSLPGEIPPELQVFENESVQQFVCQQYSVDVKGVLIQCHDHHEIPGRLAAEAYILKDVINTEACRVWVESQGEKLFIPLIEFLDKTLL